MTDTLKHEEALFVPSESTEEEYIPKVAGDYHGHITDARTLTREFKKDGRTFKARIFKFKVHVAPENAHNTYTVSKDQIFAYKRNTWLPLKGYCFIKPIKSYDKLSIEKEQPLIGIMKYTDKDLPNIKNGDLVGFTPYSEYEFIIDGERLYRVLTNQISIKYEYQGNEKEYNPSWT